MIDLTKRAHDLVCVPKGILAADESTSTADKRLAEYGIGSGKEMRRKYRDLFFNTPGIEEYLSGIILHSETLDQKDDEGDMFVEELHAKGIMVGIKVDEGTEPMPEHTKEPITKGLIGLPERLVHYRDTYDASFTKWRAVFSIDGDTLPSDSAVLENAKRLAMYARFAQQAGFVPILEPEVLYAGVHSRVRAQEVIGHVTTLLMQSLDEHAVDTTGIVLKTSMVLSGKDTKKIDTPHEVATSTLDALVASVPALVPGIVFLSGGQDDDQAMANLEAIVLEAKERRVPWELTFSFARALQDDALQAWGGKEEHMEVARDAFLTRLKRIHTAMHG